MASSRYQRQVLIAELHALMADPEARRLNHVLRSTLARRIVLMTPTDPERSLALFELALALRMNARYDPEHARQHRSEALQICREIGTDDEAVNIGPLNASFAHNLRAWIHFDEFSETRSVADAMKAAEAWQAGLEVETDPTTHLTLLDLIANCYNDLSFTQNDGKTEYLATAVEWWGRALAFVQDWLGADLGGPEVSAAMSNAGDAFTRLGRSEGKAGLLELAVEALQEGLSRASGDRGQLLARLAEAFDSLADSTDDPDQMLQRGAAAASYGLEAIEQTRDVRQRWGRTLNAAQILINQYARTGDSAELVGLFGFQRGVMVASRSQLGLPA